MFTSKDFDLNTEYTNRQIQTAAYRQQAQTAQPDNKTIFRLPSVSVNHLSISLILMSIAVLFLAFGGTAQAQQSFDALDAGDGSTTVGLDLVLTVMTLESGDTQAALDTINSVIADAPNVAAAYTLRSAIYVAQGEYDQALIDGEMALTRDDAESAAYFFMGRAAFEQERYHVARTHYNAYLTATANAPAGDLVSYLHGGSVHTLVVALIADCDRHIIAANG